MPFGSHPVAQRFTVAGMLALMTTFGLLFGGLRYVDAPAPVYLFFGSLAVVFSIVQTVFGGIPLASSAAVGALFLPLWLIVFAAIGDQRLDTALLGMPCTMFVGGFLGYCTGALATGVFSLMHMVESHVRQKGSAPSASADDPTNPDLDA